MREEGSEIIHYLGFMDFETKRPGETVQSNCLEEMGAKRGEVSNPHSRV